MAHKAVEFAFAFAAALFGIITLIGTQNVYNMYVVVVLVLIYGELVMMREKFMNQLEKAEVKKKE